MNQSADLSIIFTPPSPNASPNAIASIALNSMALGISHTDGVLIDPLTQRERADLNWYLEEYWQWPYEGFLERGKAIEKLLPHLGERLYQSVFGSASANAIAQAWQSHLEVQRQIRIVSDIVDILSLPWELLHDGQNFLAVNPDSPVSIVRCLPETSSTERATPLELPLRILLITARPIDEAFVDPRSIAHELLTTIQEYQEERRIIELEFLRPPTLSALRERLRDGTRPIHILHFDGHGTFDETDTKQGILAFEDQKGQCDLVKGKDIAKELQNSGVRLVVLNACKSATSASDNALSSIAAQLIRGGVDAVIAMSATILVDSATHYVHAFYRALAAGVSTSIAQERARRVLYNDPHRHPLRRHRDEEGTPVELYDWWLPHFYQQSPLTMQLGKKEFLREMQPTSLLLRLDASTPVEPPLYGFSGRAHELLRIERSLLQGKLVVIHGFGGIGKTAVAREVADWLIQTKMYDGACFISFEGGGDTTTLLSTLGRYLGISDSIYNPKNTPLALRRLKRIFEQQRILIIVDSLESILPGGKAALESATCTQLWNVLLELIHERVGVLVTTQNAVLNEKKLKSGSNITYLSLTGLHPEDAYTFASRLLDKLQIDRFSIPYVALRDLLAQLDHHPLIIQLVLPMLRELPLSKIKTDFPALLPKCVDNTETGRNQSLLVSLDYSLQRLNGEQLTLLPLLVLFQGGAFEYNVLSITGIPQAKWDTLRQALVQAGLLIVKKIPELITVPFLHFHPALAPYLLSQYLRESLALREPFAKRYFDMMITLHEEYGRKPELVKALVQEELPNLRRAMELWFELGNPNIALSMSDVLAWFLTFFGWDREREEVRQAAVSAALIAAKTSDDLVRAEYTRELGLGVDEFAEGHIHAAYTRFTILLERIEALPKGVWFDLGPGSYEHCMLLGWKARSLASNGQSAAAEGLFRESLTMLDVLISQVPEEQELIRQKGRMLTTLGDILRDQGRYQHARKAYEEGLEISKGQKDLRAQSVTLGQLGRLVMEQGNDAEARSFYNISRDLFSREGEPESEAGTWHNLGWIAQRQEEWKEAEKCYRESLAIYERYGNEARAAGICNNLALVMEEDGRATEAEAWLKRAVELDERACPNGPDHALHLLNLARLLETRVREKRIPATRLAEARNYAERALTIRKTLDASPEIGTTLRCLAQIAELEGQETIARNYDRLAYKASIPFVGKGYSIEAAIRDVLEYSDEEAFEYLVKALSDEEILERAVEAISKTANYLLRWTSITAVQRLFRLDRLAWNILFWDRRTPLARNSLSLSQLEQIAQTLEEEGIGPCSLSPDITPADINKRAFNYRGCCLAERGEYAASIEHFNTTLAIDPHFAPAYCNRARAYIELNHLEEALADCQTLLSFDPDYLVGRVTCQLVEELRKHKVSRENSLVKVAEEHGLLELLRRYDRPLRPGEHRESLGRQSKVQDGKKRDEDAVVLESGVQMLEPFLQAIAAVAGGNTSLQSKVEEMLDGPIWEVVHRIWAGERDEITLIGGLEDIGSALVRRVLEIIAEAEN